MILNSSNKISYYYERKIFQLNMLLVCYRQKSFPLQAAIFFGQKRYLLAAIVYSLENIEYF